LVDDIRILALVHCNAGYVDSNFVWTNNNEMKKKRKFKIRKPVEEKWTFTQWDGPPYSYSGPVRQSGVVNAGINTIE
jgi:hypothetical protein